MDGTAGNFLSSLIFPVIMVAVMYFFLIRPQKKREKEKQEMINNIIVGDDIVTIGGIHGKVVVAKEDILTIETSTTKTKLEIARWAIGRVVED